MSDIKAIIFDIGNVLFPIDFDEAFRAWGKLTGLSFEQVKTRFQFDEVHKAYERGEQTREEFRIHVCGLLGKDMSQKEFENGWNALLLEEHPEMPSLLVKLKEKYRLYALSNTNPIHIDLFEIKYKELIGLLDQAFYSSDIGAIKPEPKAFAKVLEAISLEKEDVVFFDDYPNNVAGAQQFGIQARQVENFEQLKTALADLNLLS